MKSSLLLAQLPLRPSTLQLLQERGFTGVSEVLGTSLSSLTAEWKVSLEQAGEIVQEVQSCLEENTQNGQSRQQQGHTYTTIPSRSSSRPNNRPLTASEILSQTGSSTTLQNSNACILTFSRAVDKLLGGGIALGQVTELAGAPGTGKTQWAMQAAVNTHLPVFTGGVEGSVIYVDTEGSFSPERCATMAAALIHHVQGNLKRKNMPTWKVTVDEILNSIHVYRCYDEATLWTILHALPARVEEQAASSSASAKAKPVRLIVIDSLAFLLRTGTTDSVGRSKLLMSTVSELTQLAATQHLAVLGINQMTTKINSGTTSTLVPALGESWAHAVTTRILLGRPSNSSSNSQQRTCTLTKSPRLPTGVADFQIVEEGVRGLDASRSNRASSSKRIRLQ